MEPTSSAPARWERWAEPAPAGDHARDWIRTDRGKVVPVGKYFGREPRYSREEAEAQARAAIDAAVARGRPPADEWKGLASRIPDLDRELVTRPRVDIPAPPPRRAEREVRPPRVVSDILRPRPALSPEPVEPKGPPAKPAGKRAVKAKAAAPTEAPKKRATKATAPRAAAKAVSPKRGPREPTASPATPKKGATGAAPAATKRPVGKGRQG